MDYEAVPVVVLAILTPLDLLHPQQLKLKYKGQVINIDTWYSGVPLETLRAVLLF